MLQRARGMGLDCVCQALNPRALSIPAPHRMVSAATYSSASQPRARHSLLSELRSEYPHHHQQQHSLSQCSAASAGTMHLTDASAQDSSDVLSVLRRLRTPLLVMAGCLLWGYLSSGQPIGPAFASSAMAVNVEHNAGGISLTARSAWAGAAAGMLHTLCGPDHLAGLAPLSIGRSRTAAAALGALWGLGHSTGQFILGLGFSVLKTKFEEITPMITRWSGIIVPVTLMLIGFMGIYENYFADDGDHHHEIPLESTADSGHGDLALAGGGAVPRRNKKIGFTTFFTGIVHGLAPDALFVVIPALALPTKIASIAYISFFVVGTCASMAAYTLLLGTTTDALSKDRPWLQDHLSSIASVIAISVGVLMLLAEFGFNVPLFS